MHPSHPPRWIWERQDWPQFRWDAAALAPSLIAARRAQGRALGMTRLLDPALDLAAQLELTTLEGLTTSAIEGERLEPSSLRSSIARRLGAPTAGLPAGSRVGDALAEMLIDATSHYDRPVTLDRLCGWQAALFPTGRSGLQKIRVGALRGTHPMRIVSGAIGRERVHYEAPPHARVASELSRMLAWIESEGSPIDGLVRAGIAHAWFEVIHPFEDGNGRVGRALADLLLARDEALPTRLYSLSAQLMAERDAYYAELERLSSGELDVTPWLVWFAGRAEDAAKRSEQVLSEVMRKAAFFVRHRAVQMNDRQRKALGKMLDAGAEGFDGGMTNKKYARLTHASPATAQRDLAALVSSGCLRAVGSGRSARYELAV